MCGFKANGLLACTVCSVAGSGRNIRQEALPPCVTLIRGWSGHPYAMVQEIDSSFDACAMIGYHGACHQMQLHLAAPSPESFAFCSAKPPAHRLASTRRASIGRAKPTLAHLLWTMESCHPQRKPLSRVLAIRVSQRSRKKRAHRSKRDHIEKPTNQQVVRQIRQARTPGLVGTGAERHTIYSQRG
eukprot:SAG11_NODE_1755_length_4311_cov_3.289411_4_plen_186_part_00